MRNKIVVRLINKNDLIIDSLVSRFNNETLALKEALHDRQWLLSDGDRITINREWFDEYSEK